MTNVTDSGFKGDVLEPGGLTLVDFWAEWCGPCRILGPRLDALATEFEGKARVLKLNVDENPATPAQYSIRGIPTVLFFRDGKLVDQVVGAVPQETLKQAILKHS